MAVVVVTAPEHSLTHDQQGLWSHAVRRLTKNRLAVAAGVVLVFLVVMAVATATVPAIEHHPHGQTNWEDTHAGPSTDHFFGTDQAGRDLWARTWEGTRISLKIGVASQLIVLAIGLLVGCGAALGGRYTDGVLMRFTDLMYAFPALLAVILFKAILTGRDWPIIGSEGAQVPGFPGPLLQVVLAISVVSWVLTARLVRGQMLALRETEYVLAAEAIGASRLRQVVAHMLPNTFGPVIVVVTLGIPVAIFAEAALGFIGFSLPIPSASLGTLVNDGYSNYRINVWELLAPAAAIALLMLTFTFIGDGLRDALDPRSTR